MIKECEERARNILLTHPQTGYISDRIMMNNFWGADRRKLVVRREILCSIVLISNLPMHFCSCPLCAAIAPKDLKVTYSDDFSSSHDSYFLITSFLTDISSVCQLRRDLRVGKVFCMTRKH